LRDGSLLYLLSLIRFVHSFIKLLFTFIQFDIAHSGLLSQKPTCIFGNHFLFILFDAFASLAYLLIFFEFTLDLALVVFFRYYN